jgi:hypothetical protein
VATSILQLKLIRKVFSKKSTIGQLEAYVDGVKVYSCRTLEDTFREVVGAKVSEWKIKAQTAIPTGTYVVIVNHSNRFDKLLPLLLNVPGFAGVRIHGGNSADNTEGCLLVGEKLGPGPDRINTCAPAVDKIIELINAADHASIEVA